MTAVSAPVSCAHMVVLVSSIVCLHALALLVMIMHYAAWWWLRAGIMASCVWRGRVTCTARN